MVARRQNQPVTTICFGLVLGAGEAAGFQMLAYRQAPTDGPQMDTWD